MEKELQHLLTQVSTISKKYDEIAEITGENFNIFKILKMETKEVKTHSAFLAELLNPKGSHGQGDVFLKLFIEEVREWENSRENISYCKKFELLNFNTSKAKANVEFYISQTTDTEGGRIDILIESNPNKIIIENKIHAKDQPFQLLRYKNYGKNAPLFYLTLWQWQEPSPNSKENLEEFKDYKRISYENEIHNWLEKCREKAVNHSLLRESITQYIYLIKYLTGKTLNKKMEQDMLDVICHSEKSLAAFYDLPTKDRLEQLLLEKMKNNLIIFCGNNKYTCEFYLNKYKSDSCILVENIFLRTHNLHIGFEFEDKDYKSFFFGFRCEESKQDSIKELIEIIKIDFNKVFHGASEGWWPAWQWYEDRDWNANTFLKIYSGEMIDNMKEKLKIMFDIVHKAEVEFTKHQNIEPVI